MSRQVIWEAFAKAGVLCREDAPFREKLTKADLFAWGLSGTAQSAQRRRQLLERLGLPDYVTANGLMDFLKTRRWAAHRPGSWCRSCSAPCRISNTGKER